jgi:hypothetical protein
MKWRNSMTPQPQQPVEEVPEEYKRQVEESERRSELL